MSSANPSQLFLLADHIKLSLLERQRATTLNLEPNAQDGQISRSLDSLKSGIDSIESQLSSNPSDTTLQDQHTRLSTQFSALQTQFHGFTTTTPSSTDTLTSPNSSTLAPDFAAAQQTPSGGRVSKSVRFRDSSPQTQGQNEDDDLNRSALFPSRYRDDPSDEDAPTDQTHMSNEQIHAYHSEVMATQDDQLDTLGQSIGRQRQLGMQLGDELDSQALMLDDVDEGVERHQSGLNRARSRLDKFSRKAKDNWSLSVIVVLIVVLVLLIVILK